VEIYDEGRARVSLDGKILDERNLTPMRIELMPEALNYIV